MLAKDIHVTFVVLTLLFFLLRGFWMIQGSSLLKKAWVRTLSASIDTVLLVSAIVQAITISQYPFIDHWLTAKVLALITYIVLGSIAFTYGKTKTIRVCAWLAAIACFGYIACVALTRNPTIFF